MEVEPANYGRFGTIRFLLGMSRSSLNRLWRTVQETQALYPGAKISFLAHSFGTYLVARLLIREPTLKVHRIAFCGSVLDDDFPFERISSQFTTPIFNETSARDFWPVLAYSATFGYGTAGTYGFKKPRVRDRWHRGFGHSQYLTKDFCNKYWVPFFKNGEKVESNLDDETPPLLIRFIEIVHLKFLVPLIIIIALSLAYHFKFFPFHPGEGCYQVRLNETKSFWHCPQRN